MPSQLCHLVPYADGEEGEAGHFRRDHAALIEAIRRHSCNGHGDVFLDVFPPHIYSPYPLGIPLGMLDSMQRVCSALHRGIVAVVAAWTKDPLLRETLLPMPAAAQEVLAALAAPGMPAYTEAGLWRPDTLFPAASSTTAATTTPEFQVCEVNARFPLNAYYLSHELAKACARLPHLSTASGLDGAVCQVPALPVSGLQAVPHMLFEGGGSASGGRFDSSLPVAILRRDGQKSWDAELFRVAGPAMHRPGRRGTAAGVGDAGGNEEGPRLGEVRFVDPSRLFLSTADGKLYARGSEGQEEERGSLFGPLEQFVLELQQEDLCGQMDRAVLLHMAENCRCVNDLRSVLLAHDKRMLAALTDSRVAARYLSLDDAAVLRRYLVPTYTMDCAPRDCVRLRREEWVLKPNGGGKGMGIVFGCDCSSDDDWAALLDDPAHAAYVLQPAVRQEPINIVAQGDLQSRLMGKETGTRLASNGEPPQQLQKEEKEEKEPPVCSTRMLVVGVLHCCGPTLLGPGVFRASMMGDGGSQIVNLSGGNGIVLAPAVLSSRFPLERRQRPSRQAGEADTDGGASEGSDYPLLFRIPPQCSFELPVSMLSPSAFQGTDARAFLDAVNRALVEDGIATVQVPPQGVGIGDGVNGWLLHFVRDGLGGVVNEHFDTGGDGVCGEGSRDESAVWDVRPNDLIAAARERGDDSMTPAAPRTRCRIRTVQPLCLRKSRQPAPETGLRSRSGNVCVSRESSGGRGELSAPPPRSHTSEDFPLHTDCSFERPPPRLMLLHVLREDAHCCGGLTTLVDSAALVRHLSPVALATLLAEEVDIRVPQEFYKGLSCIRGTIVTREVVLGTGREEMRLLWRYRADSVVRETCSSAMQAALDELDWLLRTDGHLVLTTKLPTGCILLLDNTRWFHGRTHIFDPRRWLKRIRFHKHNFGVQPDHLPAGPRSFAPPRHLDGVFVRLRRATEALSRCLAQLPTSFTAAAGSILSQFGGYVRNSMGSGGVGGSAGLEALQYFVLRLHPSAACCSTGVPPPLYRLLPMRDVVTVVSVPCNEVPVAGLELVWFAVQVALALLAGNRTRFVVPDVELSRWAELVGECRELSFVGHREYTSSSPGPGPVYTFGRDSVLSTTDAGGSVAVLLDTVRPSMADLTRVEFRAAAEVHAMHEGDGSGEGALGAYRCAYIDEVDLLPAEERRKLVQERTAYVVSTAHRVSPFYRERACGRGGPGPSLLTDVPPLTGEMLREVSRVPQPAGVSALPGLPPPLLADDGDRFAVSFASGGTTGAMKCVFRSAWEDGDNARYLAKGLLAAGVRAGDVVCVAFAGGFWGGSHVFSLALQYAGCSVVPLGSTLPHEQVLELLTQLRPTVLLGMPNWLLSLSEHIEHNVAAGRLSVAESSLRKIITGGEALFPAARKRIATALGLDRNGEGCVLSTGYTTNETGAIGFRCQFMQQLEEGGAGSGGRFHVHETMQHVSIESQEGPAREGSRILKGVAESLKTEVRGRGVVVTSNLNRTFMPVLRYRTGDIATWVDNVPGERCGCGRRLSTLVLHGRGEGFLRVAGEEIWVDDVAKAISMVPLFSRASQRPVMSQRFSIHLSTSSIRGLDELAIHVEANLEDVDGCTLTGNALESMVRELLLSCLLKCRPDLAPLLLPGLSSGGDNGAAEGRRMEPPLVVLYKPGTLSCNQRTGKIPPVVDTRAVV